MMFFINFKHIYVIITYPDMSQSERKHIDDFYIFNSYDKIDI